MVKDYTQGVATIAAIVGAIGLTAADKLPSEFMAGIIMTIITYVFKEREISQVRKSWEKHDRDYHQNLKV